MCFPRKLGLAEPERARNPVRGRQATGRASGTIGWHLPYCTIVRMAYPCWDDAAYRAPGHSISLPVWLLGAQPSVFSSRESLAGWQGRRCTRVLASVPVISPRTTGCSTLARSSRTSTTRSCRRSNPAAANWSSLILPVRTHLPAPRPGRKAGHVSGIRRQPCVCATGCWGGTRASRARAATRMAGRWPSRRTTGSAVGTGWMPADRCQRPPLGGRFLLPADRTGRRAGDHRRDLQLPGVAAPGDRRTGPRIHAGPARSLIESRGDSPTILRRF